jgi:alpha-L-fucosidase
MLAYSQTENQKTIAKFIITDAKNNGVDMTPIALKGGAYTVFYTSGDDGLIYMANVWPNNNSQSFGPMYGVQSDKIEETYENYRADYFYFNWRYINSYNDKTGTAKVQVIKIYKPQGVAFSVKIIPENLDVIVYKGYMDGTIDFSIYD